LADLHPAASNDAARPIVLVKSSPARKPEPDHPGLRRCRRI